MSSLPFIAKQVVIYFGIPCFLIGILGGFFNIMVFFSLHTFRQSSCAFYLTIMSIFNIAQMLTGLLPRMMTTGFNIDWTQTSLFYCKFKYFSLQFTAIISSTCLCLATIDQYFATCTRIHWQQWCNVKIAYRLVTVLTVICFLEQIPTWIFHNHIILPSISNVTCAITNSFFEKFNTYFNRAFLWYTLPILMTVLFGILAFCNVRRLVYRTLPLARRELDKQLTTMVLVQVIFNCMIIIPSLITGILIHHGNSMIRVEIRSANSINSCVFYLYFASPFYIYMCVSERFRRQFFYVVFNIDVNQ